MAGSKAAPRRRREGSRGSMVGISLIFLVLCLALVALISSYRVRILQPRLEQEAVAQAEILARSQAPLVAEVLRSRDGERRRQTLVQTLDELLLLRDPETEIPYFQSVALEVDYDAVDAAEGSLDLDLGSTEDDGGFLVDVPIYDGETFELLAVGWFRVSDRFFEQLAGDVRRGMLQVLGAVLALLALVWAAVLLLVRILQRQTLERHRAERELWQQEQRYQRLLDNLNSYFVYRRDAEGRVSFVSDSVQRVMGMTPGDVAAAFDRELPRRAEAADAGGTDGHEVQIELVSAAGDVHFVQLSEVPMRDDEGRLTGVDGIARNVTHQRLFEAELRSAKEQAEAASQAKSQFLANMSHEVRTPLNAILGMTALAQKTELTPKQRDYLDKARASGRMLVELVEDILDLSKIEAGRLEMQHRVFDLDEILSDLSDVVAVRAADSRLEILFSAAPDAPRRLEGDPVRLKQVLLNLVGNAIKFTDEGEIVVAIECVEARRGRVELRFSVRDTGVGIAAGELAQMFEPFTQADASSTRRHGGVGLGLAISRRLVEMMGGRLRAESKPGEGSTFWFTATFGLPDGDRLPRRLAPERQGLRALVADDNPTALDVLSRMLESLACRVTAVASGEAALAAAAAAEREGDPFRIAVLDWKMPPLDGTETARRMRLDTALSQPPPIILVTGHGRDELQLEALSAGIEQVIHKPVSPSTLHDAVVVALDPGSADGSRRQATGPAPGARFAAGQRVLVVEDNAINREVARGLLAAAGLEVAEAANGLEALRALETGRFDAVLMDVQMPEMDGVETVRAVRSQERLKDLPVIAMTAHAMLGDREGFLSSGMSDYLAKPVDEDQLLETLGRWLAMSAAEPAAGDAAAASPAPAATPAASLPGLEVADGLRRLNGDRRLYRQLVGELARDLEEQVPRLRELLTGADPEAALPLLHTLRGSAATLAATRVAAAAEHLERDLRADGRGDGNELWAAVAELLDTVSKLPGAASGDADGSRRSAADLAAGLGRLRKLLADHNLAAATYFEELRSLVPGRLSPTAAEIAGCLEGLDYTAAQSHLDHLEAALGVSRADAAPQAGEEVP